MLLDSFAIEHRMAPSEVETAVQGGGNAVVNRFVAGLRAYVGPYEAGLGRQVEVETGDAAPRVHRRAAAEPNERGRRKRTEVSEPFGDSQKRSSAILSLKSVWNSITLAFRPMARLSKTIPAS